MPKTLPKVVKKGKKRLGRGYGSGRGGHTVGRGQKGQKTRSKIGVLFEGVKVKKSLLKRLPFRRGRGKFKAQNKPLVINLEALNLLPDKSTVDQEILIKKGLVDKTDAERWGVKFLGGGEIKLKLTVVLPVSKGAADKIEKAGGKVLKT